MKLTRILLLTAGVTLASPSLAGDKGAIDLIASVSSRDGSGWFQAQFASVRDSDSLTSWVRCDTTTTTGPRRSASCQAYDGTRSFGCSTKDASMVAAIAAIRSDDLIIVTWNAAGQCTSIVNSTMSAMPPKTL